MITRVMICAMILILGILITLLVVLPILLMRDVPTRVPTKHPTHTPTTSPSHSPTTISPSVSPTTSIPSHTPTTSPSRTPTTISPSASPITSVPSVSPTKLPSRSPTKSPITSIPTESPTKMPSISPTLSPTITCPPIVTCYFTTFQDILEVWLNEVDMTSEVVGDLTNENECKTLTFEENPEVSTVLLAIKCYENSELSRGKLQLKCLSTYASSPWNQVLSITNTGWLGILSTGTFTEDLFPYNWYMYNYTGSFGGNIGNANADFLSLSICNVSQNLLANQGTGNSNRYFTYRKYINTTTPIEDCI
jgi:hypothetical protein